MNNIRIYAFFWMIVLLTVSCYEDKGNYDYHPINEVKISDWKKGLKKTLTKYCAGIP